MRRHHTANSRPHIAQHALSSDRAVPLGDAQIFDAPGAREKRKKQRKRPPPSVTMVLPLGPRQGVASDLELGITGAVGGVGVTRL